MAATLCVIALATASLSHGHYGHDFTEHFSEDTTYTLGGFGTTGATFSDSNTLGFKRNILQEKGATKDTPQLLTDSRIALQFSSQYKNMVQGTVQLLVRQETDTLDELLHLAYVRLNIRPELTLRGGRLPLDIYLLSGSRDVGFSYLWARPIPEFHSLLFLNSFTGTDARYMFQLGRGFLELRGGAGFFQTTLPYDQDKGLDLKLRSLWNANVNYLIGSWQFRLALMRAAIDRIEGGFSSLIQQYSTLLLPNHPGTGPYLAKYNLEGSHITHSSAGFAYDDGSWAVQGELGQIQFEKAMSLAYHSGYLSVGRHIDRFTPYVVVAKINSHVDALPPWPNPATLSETEQVIFQEAKRMYESTNARQVTASLGLRWDFHENMALKAQWNHHWVSNNSSYIWEKNSALDKDIEINTFSLNLDFVF